VSARAIDVLYTPAEIVRFAAAGGAAGRRCVVIDQLRATSTIVTALAHGARAVLAVGSVEEARRLRRARPEALLAGERGGLPLEGFDLGNSPRAFTRERVAGREIVLTTTNGTLALAACRGAAAIHPASFLNLGAVAALLREGALPATILCAGTGPDFSHEDALVAGALLALAAPAHPAAAIYRAAEADLPGVLRRTVNGRRLAALGLGGDSDDAARRDAFPIVPHGEAVDFVIEGGPVGAVRLAL